MGRFSVCQPRKDFQLFVANYSRMRILAHARKAWEGFGVPRKPLHGVTDLGGQLWQRKSSRS